MPHNMTNTVSRKHYTVIHTQKLDKKHGENDDDGEKPNKHLKFIVIWRNKYVYYVQHTFT